MNDILGFTEINAIQEVEFLSTIMDPEVASDKQSIVDVLCKDSHRNRYIAEMQLARDKGFEKHAQLYQLWNRMSSGSYFLEPVKAVAIPKGTGGGQRTLCVPSVSDRIAQTAAIANPRKVYLNGKRV